MHPIGLVTAEIGARSRPPRGARPTGSDGACSSSDDARHTGCRTSGCEHFDRRPWIDVIGSHVTDHSPARWPRRVVALETIMPTTSTTHVCLVLDKSGSMQSVYEDALGAVNGYITRAKQDRNLYEARFSLITFNSQGVDTIRANEVMETVKPLTHGEYSCAGMTPLYDAVGRGIGVLDEATAGKDAAKAILVVMTDGMENDSKEFNHAKIMGLIKARQ